jgi:hypothetical protein
MWVRNMDSEEFSKRFKQRLECFLSSIKALCENKNISWQVYDCEPELEDDGFVSMIAKPESPLNPSSELDEFLQYCTFVMNQGFRVEIVFDWSMSQLKICITAWENEDEPEWDESIKSDFVLRWNGVKGPAALGM